MDRQIAALIPAAGRSSRMGALKPLLPIGPHTLVEMAIEVFIRAGVHDVRVVVGHRAQEIIPVVERHGAKCVFNPDYDEGMFSSILAGARDLEPDIEGFYLLPVDIPLVMPETIASLGRVYSESHAGILYPRFQGRRGHPPLLSVRYMAKGLPTDLPGGLRTLLHQHERDALDVDVQDEAILMDCDTREDYEKLCARYLKIPRQLP